MLTPFSLLYIIYHITYGEIWMWTDAQHRSHCWKVIRRKPPSWGLGFISWQLAWMCITTCPVDRLLSHGIGLRFSTGRRVLTIGKTKDNKHYLSLCKGMQGWPYSRKILKDVVRLVVWKLNHESGKISLVVTWGEHVSFLSCSLLLFYVGEEVCALKVTWAWTETSASLGGPVGAHVLLLTHNQ